MEIKDREKLVKDLMDTFNEGSELNKEFKERMKQVILMAVDSFMLFLDVLSKNGKKTIKEDEVIKFVDLFVEEVFKIEQ